MSVRVRHSFSQFGGCGRVEDRLLPGLEGSRVLDCFGACQPTVWDDMRQGGTRMLRNRGTSPWVNLERGKERHFYMLKLRNKLNKKGGFTLVEMLIVVAIIAILVAVSIPLITGALERTRIATDAANERAAKAEATIAYLSDSLDTEVIAGGFEAETAYAYDAANGKLVAADGTLSGVTPYGKCTTHKHNEDKYIFVYVSEEGQVYVKWDEKTFTGATFTENDWNKDLCGDTINK